MLTLVVNMLRSSLQHDVRHGPWTMQDPTTKRADFGKPIRPLCRLDEFQPALYALIGRDVLEHVSA